MKTPRNAFANPISRLIEQLQKLPIGTTYKELQPVFYGGESPESDLGTGYMLRIEITEGFSPPRPE